MLVVHAATKLLDDFRALPGRVERPRTFMEIAGYPHYENVCSNILAFFMDPVESHGLGTLVLDALASAGGIVTADEGVGGNVSVEREVSTDAGNRIDIFVESDDRAILIENKIYASANNPFGDYTAYLNRRTLEGRAKHKLLLTLYPTNEGSSWHFTNLTYTEFVGEIRSLLGHHIVGADTRYLTMFLDFLNTLENLQKGTRMDQEFVELLAERHEQAESFFYELMSFKEELRTKVQELGALIKVEEYPNVIKQDVWRQKGKLFDILYHDIRVSEDLPVVVDTIISPRGWTIRFGLRRGDRSNLKELLQKLGIPSEEGGWHLFHPARFAYDEDLDQIRPALQDLVDKLATS